MGAFSQGSTSYLTSAGPCPGIRSTKADWGLRGDAGAFPSLPPQPRSIFHPVEGLPSTLKREEIEREEITP